MKMPVKLLIAVIFFCVTVQVSFAQTINTIAGGDVFVDNVIGTDATLRNPIGVKVAAAGNVYIADQNNFVVRRVDAGTGEITTVAGIPGVNGFSGDGGLAVNAELGAVSNIFIHPITNDLYIAEGDRVRFVEAGSGIISTIAGGGSTSTDFADGGFATDAALSFVRAVVVDTTDNSFYLAENGANVIRKVDPSGIISTVAGQFFNFFSNGDGGLPSDASFGFIADIALDTLGDLYIADNVFNGTGSIRKIDFSADTIGLVAGGGPTFQTDRGEGGPANGAWVELPFGVFVDSNQNVFFSEINSMIRRVDAASGIITTVAGDPSITQEELTIGINFVGDGGLAADARFNGLGLGLDNAGNIFIADEINQRIRRVDSGTDIVSTVAGGYIGESVDAFDARLYSPVGVIKDVDGNIYFSDAQNHRVRRIDSATNIVTTIAGTGTYGDSGDGGLATAAELSDPWGGMDEFSR